MPMPPSPAPNQASADAKAGTERAPPISAAIGFSATTTIHGAPNDTPRMTSDRARDDPRGSGLDAGRHSVIRRDRSLSGANPNVSRNRAA